MISFKEVVFWNSNSYGRVLKVTPGMIGFLFDRIIPSTFFLIQFVFTFLFGKKELFRLDITWIMNLLKRGDV